MSICECVEKRLIGSQPNVFRTRKLFTLVPPIITDLTRVQLERDRSEVEQRRPRRLSAVERGRPAVAGPVLFRGQPRRPDRVDGELRRAVAAAAGRGRPAQGRWLERLGRLGRVHENVWRRDGRTSPAVRPAQAQLRGQAVRGPGHGGRQVQRTRVRTGVRPDGGHGARAAGGRGAQRGGGGRRPADRAVRPVNSGRREGRLAPRPIRLAA